MKLEVGKSYRCRDGLKVTITRVWCDPYPFWADVNGDPRWKRSYTEEGQYLIAKTTTSDIIAEWTEPGEPSPITEKTMTVTKYVLPDGREFGTREEAEAAHRLAELAQEVYDNTDIEDHLTAQSVAEFLLNNYTLTPKGT